MRVLALITHLADARANRYWEHRRTAARQRCPKVRRKNSPVPPNLHDEEQAPIRRDALLHSKSARRDHGRSAGSELLSTIPTEPPPYSLRGVPRSRPVAPGRRSVANAPRQSSGGP